MLESRSRNEYIDCMKAIGICLVILGHTFGGGLLALKTYHMPLFFFIAGLLINEEESMGSFIKKRFYRLFIPFLGYEIFFLCMHNFLYQFGMVSNYYVYPYDYINRIVHIICFDNCEILLAPIWFVTVLFIASIACKVILFLLSVSLSRLDQRYRFAVIAAIGLMLIYAGMMNGRKGIWNIKLSYNCPQIIVSAK